MDLLFVLNFSIWRILPSTWLNMDGMLLLATTEELAVFQLLQVSSLFFAEYLCRAEKDEI